MVEIIWSQNRVTVFLHIWNLLMPLKIILASSGSLSFIYAGLWMYSRGGNPFSEAPFLLSIFYAGFMFPFYIPGIIIASYVWNGFKNPNLTRQRYLQVITLLQIVYLLLLWVVPPCPFSTTPLLCIPVPSTGFVALVFVSKVVKKLDSPWTEID